MGDVIGSIWWLIVTLGLLVTFHEFGHFWVARRLGVRVLRFSVGFGKPLWLKRGRDGTEYCVAAIPLGGYVKMLDEREEPVAADDLSGAFNRKPVWSRIAIVAAGPIANLIFAVFAFWLMFVVGRPDYVPVVGQVDGAARASGFVAGDRLLAVAGRDVPTWTDALLQLARHSLDRDQVAITVRDARGDERQRTLDLRAVEGVAGEPLSLDEIGMVPRQRLIPPVLSGVSPDSPAQRAGIKADDRIVAIENEPIEYFSDISAAIARHAAPGKSLAVAVERHGERLQFRIEPALDTQDPEEPRYVLGVAPRPATMTPDALLRYGPVEALGAAVREMGKMTGETFALLGRMIVGRASLSNLSGPITIAQFANDSAKQGLSWFLWFLGLISLSLGILNLLPIPILDGGHLLYYLIELVKGSPVSERVLVAGQYVGLVMLAGLMGLAFFNDIMRQIP
jgi:regulator of sigma E protease